MEILINVTARRFALQCVQIDLETESHEWPNRRPTPVPSHTKKIYILDVREVASLILRRHNIKEYEIHGRVGFKQRTLFFRKSIKMLKFEFLTISLLVCIVPIYWPQLYSILYF
jgi:hypothetical protein